MEFIKVKPYENLKWYDDDRLYFNAVIEYLKVKGWKCFKYNDDIHYYSHESIPGQVEVTGRMRKWRVPISATYVCNGVNYRFLEGFPDFERFYKDYKNSYKLPERSV